jgi:hypothetical protein
MSIRTSVLLLGVTLAVPGAQERVCLREGEHGTRECSRRQRFRSGRRTSASRGRSRLLSVITRSASRALDTRK